MDKEKKVQEEKEWICSQGHHNPEKAKFCLECGEKRKVREEKEVLSKYYSVSITFLNNKTKTFTAFLDTGNNLYDPYKKRPVILISKSALSGYNPRCILVPCLTVNKESLIKCFKIKKLIVNGNLIEDECLIGISDNNFNFDDVDLLLHNKIVKER